MASAKMWATPSVDSFVDLSASSEEDDDEDVVLLTEFPAHLAHRPSRKSQTGTIVAVNSSDLVILEDVDKTIELHFRAGLEKEPRKTSQRLSQNGSVVDDDDDCCMLSEDPSKVGIVEPSCGNDSDDLVITGEVGQVACRDFPHARHQCVQFPFKTTSHEVFCSQCHCYVCDMLAPCSLWGDGTRGGDHCHASDKIGETWKMLRKYNKTHPTGSSDTMTLQQLLSPGGRPSAAGKFDSSTQRCLHPAGHEHLLLQPKEFVSQCFSHLFGSERGSRDFNHFEALASTGSSTRRFSLSPPVNTGNNEPTTFRGLPGCRPGPDDSTRSQHPLQIALNRQNRDRDRSQELGMRTTVLSHGYMHSNVRKMREPQPNYPNLYLRYQPGGDSYQRRRVRKRRSGPPPLRFNGCSEIQPPLSSCQSGSIQRSQATSSAVPSRRPSSTAAATVLQESFEVTDPHMDTVLSEGFLEGLSPSQSFLPSSYLDRRGLRLQRQPLQKEPPPVSPPLHFGSSAPASRNEIGAYNNSSSQGIGIVGSCNSVLRDAQFSRGGGSLPLNKADEGILPFPSPSSPTLLAHYLLEGDDGTFWDDLTQENWAIEAGI